MVIKNELMMVCTIDNIIVNIVTSIDPTIPTVMNVTVGSTTVIISYILTSGITVNTAATTMVTNMENVNIIINAIDVNQKVIEKSVKNLRRIVEMNIT